MSFASDVKTEMLQKAPPPCCQTAQGAALLLFGRLLSQERISMRTEHPGVANAYREAVHGFTGEWPELIGTENGSCKIEVTDPLLTEAVLSELEFAGDPAERRLPQALLKKRCCRVSFLRGAFLCAGTVTDPEKDYHLEIACPGDRAAAELSDLMRGLGFFPKTVLRGAAHIVYVKNSERIGELLATMGAGDKMLEMVQSYVAKDIRNTVNRRVNFERANIARSMAASNRQYEAICRIRDTVGLETLPEDLRSVALARLENRDLGVSELRSLLPGNLTVSGLTHRFQRIIARANSLKEE